MATLGNNFCIAPFTQLTFGPMGNYSPCPEIGGRPWVESTASPIRMWSSEQFEALRNDFKSNKKNSICQRCWNQEEHNNQSLRRRLFVERKIFKPNEALDFFKSSYQLGPKQINLITSNICNLRCRICNARSSVTYNVEGKVYEKILGEKTRYTTVDKKSVQLSQVQLDEIFQLSKNLQRLEFYGGEPLLDDQTLVLLEKYVASGQSQSISLMYNTNGMNLPTEQHFKLWPQFKSVDFNISIDDIDYRYTYNRHPGIWSTMLETIGTLKEQKGNYNLFAICTVSVLNIFYIPEILDEIDRLGLKCFINHTHGPVYYNIENLPKAVKQRIKDKLLTYRDQSRIKFLINMLDAPENSEAWSQFKFWTLTKDNYRKENFSTVYPEFYDVIKQYDDFYANTPNINI